LTVAKLSLKLTDVIRLETLAERQTEIFNFLTKISIPIQECTSGSWPVVRRWLALWALVRAVDARTRRGV
jgi:hypothetical protein